MRYEQIRCDRCNKPKTLMSIMQVDVNKLYWSKFDFRLELCRKCLKDLKKWIKNIKEVKKNEK